MKFSYFDDANKEYVITTPQTPYPWINYLGSQEFFSLISNTAGGYSFYKDARLRRITRFRYNNVPLDLGGGRYFTYMMKVISGHQDGHRQKQSWILRVPSWNGIYKNQGIKKRSCC